MPIWLLYVVGIPAIIVLIVVLKALKRRGM